MFPFRFKAVGPVMYTKTCLYAMTYDRHFVVDDLRLKGMPQIILCMGAGHAYKYCQNYSVYENYNNAISKLSCIVQNEQI